MNLSNYRLCHLFVSAYISTIFISMYMVDILVFKYIMYVDTTNS